MLSLAAAILIVPMVCEQACLAQDDYYPMPQRNANSFGYPFPPPAVGEPGVTALRRYMLDGIPDLEFNPRPQDELWLISTRHLDGVCESPEQLICKRAVGTGWEVVPIENLIAVHGQDVAQQTFVVIHGNRTPAFWARRRGKQIYQSLFGNVRDAAPVRFVIWSWPSEELDRRPVQDFLKKADRAVVEGHSFAKFLTIVDRRRQITMLTYSLGAQVSFTAFADISRTENALTGTCGCSQTAVGARKCFKVGMIAPVTQCEWPDNTEQVRMVNQQVEQLTSFRNPRDQAIIAFRIICSVGKKQGFKAPQCIDAIADCGGCNVKRFDVSKEAGSEHNVTKYIRVPKIREQMRLLFESGTELQNVGSAPVSPPLTPIGQSLRD